VFRTIEMTVPPKTTVIFPITETVKLSPGTLSLVRFVPPPGPSWEVYARLLYREFQLIPREEGEWIPLEKYAVEIRPNWSAWDGTYFVDVEMCSPQARYSHQIIVELEVEEGVTMRSLLAKLIGIGR